MTSHDVKAPSRGARRAKGDSHRPAEGRRGLSKEHISGRANAVANVIMAAVA